MFLSLLLHEHLLGALADRSSDYIFFHRGDWGYLCSTGLFSLSGDCELSFLILDGAPLVPISVGFEVCYSSSLFFFAYLHLFWGPVVGLPFSCAALPTVVFSGLSAYWYVDGPHFAEFARCRSLHLSRLFFVTVPLTQLSICDGWPSFGLSFLCLFARQWLWSR